MTYDAERGYIASAPELRQPIVALSLTSLRKRIEALLMPEKSLVVLQLDGLRRARAPPAPGAAAAGALSRALGRVFIKLRLVTAN